MIRPNLIFSIYGKGFPHFFRLSQQIPFYTDWLSSVCSSSRITDNTGHLGFKTVELKSLIISVNQVTTIFCNETDQCFQKHEISRVATITHHKVQFVYERKALF